MPANVDNRVIQMQFENRQFEKNIAKSQKSIEDLKEAMDFEETSRGLEKFTRATERLNFGTLEGNLQRLADKFTGIGNAGEYVISRIRATIEGAARELEYFVKSLTTSQISVGEDKYNQLNKAVMAIVSSGKYTEEQAYSVMERAQLYTDQTSHSFQTMVTMIAALTSTGMGLREAELLIEGIGNAATYAGKGAQEAAMSMSVLAKTMTPSSFLGYEKFLQLQQTQGVITEKWYEQALLAGEAMGTLKKKGDEYFVSVKGQKAVKVAKDNFAETLKYRWLTGSVLQELYKNYQFANSGNWEEDKNALEHPTEAVESFGKTAYLTGQRALTLADAFNAVRESVSSGWVDTFRILFGDVTEAAEHFTNIADRIIEFLEKIKEFRNGLMQVWSDSGGKKSFFQILLGDYEDDVETGAVGFLDLLEGAGKQLFNGFKDFMMLFARPIDKAAVAKNPAYFSTYLGYVLSDAMKGIQEFFQKIRDFFNEGIDVNGQTKSRLQVFHDIVMGIAGALKIAYDIISGIHDGFWTIVQQLMPSFDSIIGLFSDLGSTIYDIAEDTSKGNRIQKFFTDLATTLKPITDGVNSVVEAFAGLLRLILGLDGEDKDRSETFKVFGDVLKILADVIAKTAGPILTFISSIINAITELFSGGISQEKVKKFGEQLGQAFSTMMQAFADNLPESFKFLKNWIYDLFGLWEDETQGDSKSFFTFLRTLFTGGFKNFGDLLSQLTSGFSLKKFLETGLGFGQAFNFLNTIIGAFKGTNLYNVLMAFLGVATIGSLFLLIRKIRSAFRVVEAFFQDVGDNTKGFLTKFKQGFMGDYEWVGERLLNIAKAIAIMVAAVWVLGSMNSERMIQGIGGLVLVMASLFGALWFINNNLKGRYLDQVAIEAMIVSLTGMVVGIALALSVLSLALIPLSQDPKKMITAVLAVAGMLAAIGIFIKLMLQSVSEWTFGAGATKQWSGIAKMAAILFTIAGVVTIMALGLSALFVALTPLAMIGWEGMVRAIVAFGAVLAILGTFIVVMLKQMDEFVFGLGGGRGWSGYGKMAVMLLTLSATIGLLAVGIGALVIAITPLSLMSWGGLVRAVGGLGIILTELGIFMKYLQTLTVNDKTASLKIAGFAAFAASLGILIYALTPLALMPWKAWSRAMVGLGIVLLELGFMIQYITNMNAGDSTATLKIAGLAGFALSMAILMHALTPLASMEWDGLWRALIGFGVVLAELVLFMLATSKMPIGVGQLGPFIGFAMSLAILLFALKPLAEMSPQGYQQALIGLGTVMLEIVVLMAIMKEMKPDLASAGSVLLMLIGLGASMILFGIAFNEVKDVPWQNIVAFAAGIGILLVAIAGAAALAKGAGISGMLIAVLGLAAVLGVLSLLIPVVMGSFAQGLDQISGSLNLISSMMETFSGRMDGVSEGSIDRSQGLIDKVKGIFESLIGFGSYAVHVNAFATALYDLGTALEIFQYHTGNVKSVSENSAIDLIKELAANAGNLDLIAQMNLDSLTAKLSGLGGAMMLYAEGAKQATGIGEEDYTDVSGAMAVLTAISESLTKDGGFTLPEKMPEEDEIGLFGAQLAALAGALVKFEEAGKGLGEGTKQALKTLDFFKDLKQKLLETDLQANMEAALGAFQDGEEKITPQILEEFGKNIEQLGLSLNAFAKATTSVNEETGEIEPVDYDVAIAALESFSNLQSRLPTIGGIQSWINGNQQTLKDLGAQIETVGKNLNEFSRQVTGQGQDDFDGIDTKEAENAVKVLDIMIDCMQKISNRLPTIGGLGNAWNTFWSGRKTTLTDIGTELGKLGEGLGEFGSKIQGKFADNAEEVITALTAIDGIVNLIMHLASADNKVYSGSMVDYATNLNMFLEAFVNGTKDMEGNTDYYASLEKIVEIMQWVSTELDKTPDIKVENLEKFKLLTDALANLTSMDVTGSEVEYESIGTAIATGIAAGIVKGTSIVTEAAKNLAVETYNATMQALDAASPSKLFTKVGGYIGLGMAKGIRESESDVTDAATGMTEQAIQTASTLVQMISDILSDEANNELLITPVLDMTNMNAGLDDFNRRLSSGQLGLNVGASAAIAGRLGYGEYEAPVPTQTDLSGVYNRIDTLSEQILSMKDSIAKMKLVLDTGVVAGGVANRVDEIIGQKIWLLDRNNSV